MVFDTGCKYLYLNDTVLQHYQRTEQEVLGRSITELFPRVKGTRNFQNLLNAIKGNYIKEEVEGLTETKWLVEYKPSIMDGRVEYVLVRAKKLAQALKASSGLG